jgi:octaprenyl-diphosphate synthase
LTRHATLDGSTSLLAADMQAVDRLICDHMQSPITTIPQLAGHLVASGGKRIRPLICLSVARMLGYAGQHHLTLAACVEFIHTATLLHDDVVDESLLRRGSPSANSVWGNQASVLVGDFLFSRAFELMVEMESLPVLGVLSAASSRIAEGEVLQLMSRQDIAAAQLNYFDMIEAKTAKLFEASAQGAALLSGASPEEEAALKDYGRLLGLSFQVVDDVLDYECQDQASGKTLGIDFSEGQVTLPVIFAFENADPQEKAFWLRTLQEGKQEPEDFAHAQELLLKSGGLQLAKDQAKAFATQAQEKLSAFAGSPFKQTLLDLATLSADRGA